MEDVYAFIGDKCYGGSNIVYDCNGNNGVAIIPVSKKGIYTVKWFGKNTDGTINPRLVRTATVTISEPNSIVPVTLNTNYGENGEYGDLSFNNTTDVQFAAIVSALDEGKLTTDDLGWSYLSSVRTVQLSAMPATYVGESHDELTSSMWILNKGGKTFTDGKQCHYVVGIYAGYGYMNPTNTNKGSWKDSARRKWCNEIFRNAIPEPIRSCFKQFKCVTATEYNSSTITTTDDYFALPAAKEVVGTKHDNNIKYYATQAENDALTIFEYCNADRYNKYVWCWLRSPYMNNQSSFLYSDSNKYLQTSNSSNTDYTIIPFGCI